MSIKKLAPYRDEAMRLRTSIYNQKIKSIKKSVKTNKKMLQNTESIRGKQEKRTLGKLKQRATNMKLKRLKSESSKKLKITNLSNP